MHVQLNSAPLKSLQLLVLDSNFAERYINNFDAKWIVSPKVWLRHAGIDASSVEAVAAPDGGATPVGGPPLPDQELLCGGANSIRTSRGATRSQFKVEPILIAWEMFTSIKDPTRTNLESLLKQVMDRCRGGVLATELISVGFDGMGPSRGPCQRRMGGPMWHTGLQGALGRMVHPFRTLPANCN